MDLIPGLSLTSSALEAQKIRLETVAQNIANANTTKGPDGNPYQRQMISFVSYLDAAGQHGVKVSEVMKDETPGPLIHSPGHPHANSQGMVRLPNVHTAMEMIDLISASRSYEANLTVAKTAREMASRALEIGRS